MRRILLVLLTGLAIVILPDLSYARKAIKTVEFFFAQSDTDKASGETHYSPALYIYIPETGFQLRTAWVEVNWEGDNVLTTSAAIGINGANTQTFGALNSSYSGENLDYLLRYNATDAFSGMLGNGTNNGPYILAIRSTGGIQVQRIRKVIPHI